MLSNWSVAVFKEKQGAWQNVISVFQEIEQLIYIP